MCKLIQSKKSLLKNTFSTHLVVSGHYLTKKRGGQAYSPPSVSDLRGRCSLAPPKSTPVIVMYCDLDSKMIASTPVALV